MTIKVGGPLAVKDSASVYELFILDAEGKAISVGYGILDSEGMLVRSFLTLDESIDSMHEFVRARNKASTA